MAKKTKAATTPGIREELIRLTGVNPKDGETAEKFRARLAKAAGDLSDEVWSGLPEVAQDWVNAAAESINNKQPAPEFPDASSGTGGTETTTPPATGGEKKTMKKSKGSDPAPEATEKPTKKTKKAEKPASTPEPEQKPAKKLKKAEKPAKTEKPAKEPKVRAARGPRMDSPVSQLRQLVMKNPDMNVDAIKQLAAKENLTLSGPTIQTIYSHTAATMKIARQLGLAK